jgi:HEAT repeat-containing protein 5
LLLEQYQAPITAALTPAFSADSTPEILASAVKACAVFVGSGIVKDVARMGRVLKLLTSALEQSKGNSQQIYDCGSRLSAFLDAGTISLGDARDLSPNASVMLRIAIVSAWAELAVASVHQPYLLDVLKPYGSTLASSWIASLRDYASIQAGSEASQDASSVTIDASSFSLGKEIFLPVRLLIPYNSITGLMCLRIVLSRYMGGHFACRNYCDAARGSIRAFCN